MGMNNKKPLLNNDDQIVVDRLTHLVGMALVKGMTKEERVSEKILCEVVAGFGANVLKLIYDLWGSAQNKQLYEMIDIKFNALKPIKVDYTDMLGYHK